MPATIYVTDDDPAIRSAVIKRLSRRQHRVTSFDSGEALLTALDRVLPDLILLDLKMPGLSGLDTLRAVRIKCPPVARHHADCLWHAPKFRRCHEARSL